MKRPEDIYVLVACERSQEVCKAFRALGFMAFSNDTEDCYGGHPEWHIKGDAIKALYSRKWDLVIGHPPCTRLAYSGVRWLSSKTPRKGYSWSDTAKTFLRDDPKIWNELFEGCKFFNHFVLYGKLGHKVAIENPVQHKYAMEEINAKWTQLIHPHQFGHMEKKRTLLFLFGLPVLKSTHDVYNEMMKLPKSQSNKIHYAGKKDRQLIRSKTFPGIAKAMSIQWGDYLLNP